MSQHAGTAPEPARSYGGPERRAYVRYVRLRDAGVRTSTAPTHIFGVAVIREVSVSGLNLFLTSRVKEGTVLEVAPRGLDFPRPLLARVVRAAPQANGWSYGCELANHLSDGELQQLLS